MSSSYVSVCVKFCSYSSLGSTLANFESIILAADFRFKWLLQTIMNFLIKTGLLANLPVKRR